MDNKNYYDILGIPQNATPDTIKKAYKVMAMKWHPDKNTYDTSNKFKEISEAYQTLSNEKLREDYNNNLRKPNFNVNKNINFKSPFELFNDIFKIINTIINTELSEKYFEDILINNMYPIFAEELNNLNKSINKRRVKIYLMNNYELDKLINEEFKK